MKTKITYLLLILPLLTFAQGPFNFDTAGSVEGFVAGSTGEPTASAASTLTQSGADLKIDFAIGQTKSPTISNPTAGIDADNTVNFIEIRLKNIGTASYLRVGPNTGASYANVVISTNDTDYKTYIVDVTAWTGPAVGINLSFKLNNSTTAGGNYKPTAAEYMLIDYIKPLAFLVTPEVNTFNFTTTAEGFDKTTRASAVPATESTKGTLQVTYLSGINTALAAVVGLNSSVAHVEGANKYAHATLKNTTTNTKFQLQGKVGNLVTLFDPIQTFTASDADYKTYDFDLSTWDSGYQFPVLNVAVKDTWSATATYADGDIVISGNTYYKNISGSNSGWIMPQTDFANWVVVNAAGDVADATPATNGAIVGGALDKINSIYIDSIVFDNVYVPVVFTPAPNASAQTFCSATTVASLVATGTDLKWYANTTGGTVLATSEALTTQTYYVSQTLNTIESARTAVAVTITAPLTTSAIRMVGAANAVIPTVVIGTQTWTAKNLDVATYSDGTVIPQVTDPTEWANLTTGAWCYYNNDPANGAIYGKLYNRFAVNDSRGLAPIGFHIPTENDWTTLNSFLGGNIEFGGKIKEIGTLHWSSPNYNATNSSNFTALPGGSRDVSGSFSGINYSGFWWTSSLSIENNNFIELSYNSGSFSSPHTNGNYAHSVRLIKD